MFSFLGIFSCCIRRQHSTDTVDERSRLIPQSAEPPPDGPPSIVVVDQQKLMSKLGTIVRSKEGKMVNVNAKIPFNLHNRVLSGNHDPSSSRSASTSTFAHHQTRPQKAPEGNQEVYGTPPRSPPPPPPSLRGSRSPSSPRGDTWPGSEGEGESDYFTENRPILNVRLVRSFSSGIGNRRGRMKARIGEGNSFHKGEMNKGKDRGLRVEVDSGVDADGGAISSSSSAEVTPTAVSRKSTPTASSFPKPSPSIPSPLHQNFKIRDIGSVALSWGD